MNTNMHVTAKQARAMLKAVRITRGMAESMTRLGTQHTLPTVAELGAAEQMLLAALERIRDLETRRAVK